METETTWQVLLSYDANKEFYTPLNESLNFSKIEDETKDFRLALIILLLDAEAENIASYVKSTILFTIKLGAGENPTEFFDKLFQKSFKGKADFHYMIQCTVNQNNYPTFISNNEMSFHATNFQLEVEKGVKLLPLIKKVI